MSSKPGATIEFGQPTAHFRDFCYYLGIYDPPQNGEMALLMARGVLQSWKRNPRALEHVLRDLGYMENNLRHLPSGTRYFVLARTLVMALFSGADELHGNENYEEIVVTLRANVTRTPGQHFEIVCRDLGIGVPSTPQEARSLGAHVIKAMQMPGHTERVVRRLHSITTSLRFLTPREEPHPVARALVARVANQKRIPKKLRENPGYQRVAERLTQAMPIHATSGSDQAA